MPSKKPPLTVASFTMELALGREIPTFAGGLGVLSADIMRSCGNLRVPAAFVTICWQFGYLRQHIAFDGTQSYEQIQWDPARTMQRLDERVTLRIEGRDVTIGAWAFGCDLSTGSTSSPQARSEQGGEQCAPAYFLDTNLPENQPEDRKITEQLYGGDGTMRLKQEMVLGIGGLRMLRRLGYGDIRTFHMNEGHTAFLTLERLRERGYRDDAVRSSCVFTTHTPVAAGHDIFDYDLSHRVAGDMLPWHIRALAGADRLSMTHLGMHLSKATFAVSRVHAEVSRHLFPGATIDSITNGVHHIHWCSPEMQQLFDRVAGSWREDPHMLEEHCREFPDEDVWHAHQTAKKRLIDEVNKHTLVPFDTEHLTIASARRVVAYKRPELLYTNLERLKEIGCGRLQIIHAGNAHPQDQFGQDVIRRMIERSQMLKDCVKIVYLPNYNSDLAKLLVAGADIWLNTPTRLHEASGTSGMKAALNGTINLSTLDGWWMEGYERDPEAGWRIGPLASALNAEDTRQVDAEDLYTQLQYQVIPSYYYRDRVRWIRRMKRSIGLAGHFNTHRVVKEYLEKAWRIS